jgi:hypothetical protein
MEEIKRNKHKIKVAVYLGSKTVTNGSVKEKLQEE